MEREPLRVEQAMAVIVMEHVEVRLGDMRDHIGIVRASFRCNAPLVAARTIAKVVGVVPMAHIHDARNGVAKPILLDGRADRGRVMRVAVKGADVRGVHCHEIRGMKRNPLVHLSVAANAIRFSREKQAFGGAAMRDGDGRRHTSHQSQRNGRTTIESNTSVHC